MSKKIGSKTKKPVAPRGSIKPSASAKSSTSKNVKQPDKNKPVKIKAVTKAAVKKPVAKKPAAKKPVAKKVDSKSKKDAGKDSGKKRVVAKPVAKKAVAPAKKPVSNKPVSKVKPQPASGKLVVKADKLTQKNSEQKKLEQKKPESKKLEQKKPETKAASGAQIGSADKAADKTKSKKVDSKTLDLSKQDKTEVSKSPVKKDAKALAKEVEEKVATPSVRKDKESPMRSAATAHPYSGAGKSTSTKSAPPPIKVEPKIIETSQPEVMHERLEGDLFTREELSVFRGLLNEERQKILTKARKAMEEGNIAIDRNELMDEVDQASAMVEQNLVFRLLDRDRKLLTEIDHALLKLDSGEYGYCEGTGEPIPKRRLELRPWCRHSVKYKEKLERMKKSGRGVVDEDEL